MPINENHKDEILALFGKGASNPLLNEIPPNTTSIRIPIALHRIRHTYIEDVKLNEYVLRDGTHYFIGDHAYREGKTGPIQQIIVVSKRE